MKISLNWLKQYLDPKVSDDELIRLIGARLVEVEAVVDETHKYDRIYIAKVITSDSIPGTHLSLCQIDAGPAGSNAMVQVVCGAPNVRAGMLAVWIAPGATVPASFHDPEPFIISRRRMLNQYDSFGMLAGADELDFGDDHSGIVEIDPATAQPGDAFADIFALNDKILEIENKSLTHRPDCFGLIGFAREVSALLGQKLPSACEDIIEPHGDGHQQARSKNTQTNIDRAKPTITADPALCPRYSALLLEKHHDPKSPYLTSAAILLAKSGIRPLNPVVDATNFVMLLTGQPLHAFDYDKFLAVGQSATAQIGVRTAKPNEKLTLLDGRELELQDFDIVITSNDVPVALAGAMGGLNTAVDPQTTRILLESATFNLKNLRKTSMAHGVFSESLTRFTKGQPAHQTLSVAHACADLLSDAYQIAQIADYYPNPAPENVVEITTDAINHLLGTDYSQPEIVQCLTNVGFMVAPTGPTLSITAPAWRTDIHISEDIIEEVGRLRGYDNITPTLPLHLTASRNPMLSLKTTIRDFLSAHGANELLTYTFISQSLLKKVGQSPQNSYKLVNSLSPELAYLRQSITPSLLQKSAENLKHQHANFCLFELNQVFAKSFGLHPDHTPIPHHHLALVSVGTATSTTTRYYFAKQYLFALLAKLGIDFELRHSAVNIDIAPYFDSVRSAGLYLMDDTCLGIIGELKPSVLRRLKLPAGTSAFEIDLTALLAHPAPRPHIAEPSAFPAVARDVTLTTNKPYQAILDQLTAILTAEKFLFTISPVSIYQPDSSKTLNLTFHLNFSAPDRTLTATEIDALMSRIEQIH